MSLHFFEKYFAKDLTSPKIMLNFAIEIRFNYEDKLMNIKDESDTGATNATLRDSVDYLLRTSTLRQQKVWF